MKNEEKRVEKRVEKRAEEKTGVDQVPERLMLD